MTSLRKSTFLGNFLKLLPIILLFVSVLNEFDANYLQVPYLSFNFAYILIFFWTLKRIDHFGYGLIFVAGIINDVVTGVPIGLSSFLYMLICAATSYLRSITLRPNIIKDWFYFLFIISFVNSIYYMVLSYIFIADLNYKFLLVNNFSTFLVFFLFHFLFNYYHDKFIGKSDV